jgi:hypothetical protein
MTHDTDQLVDRVLAGLKQTAPPAGLEQRVLTAMREAQSRQVAARPRPWLWTWGLALAGTAVGLCLAVSVAHRRQPTTAPNPYTGSAIASAPAGIEAPVPPIERAGQSPRPHLRPTHLRTFEAESVRERLALSYPAPPLPLTEQERLLLRLAHKGDPVELAMLDPAQRAARNQRERAEFLAFFEPPTIGETK